MENEKCLEQFVKKNEIDTDAAKELLLSGRRGVLAVNGDDGYPYAIPINYVYDKDAQKIYPCCGACPAMPYSAFSY